MKARVGIVGVSGYAGGELLRLCAGHPELAVAYVAGETSAGQPLAQLYPWFGPDKELVIERFDPEEVSELDLVFVSLPTGQSGEPLSRLPESLRVVDVGGDHRFADGWTYGLTELPGARGVIATTRRLANPGCYPVAALLALAPLVAGGLVETTGLIVDAKSGISGAGRGGGGGFGYSEANEDVVAYGLTGHDHAREMHEALSRLAGQQVSLTFTPHLIPMTRGILATCYACPRGRVTAQDALAAARDLYADAPFVRVVELQRAGRYHWGPHTKWTYGSNLAYVAYAGDGETGTLVALAVADNLGKGAAGQAVQNANLMLGLPETAGLTGAPLWP